MLTNLVTQKPGVHQLTFLLLALISLLTACVTTDEKADGPSLTEADIVRRIRPGVADPQGWARDIASAIAALERAPTERNVCSVIAVIEQESGYQADPKVNNLPRIVRDGLLEKLKPLGPLARPALKGMLALRPPGREESFGRRIDKLRSERDLDLFFRDLAAAYRDRVPGTYVVASALSRLVGPGDFSSLNPVTTVGSMQVRVDFAKSLDELDDLDEGDLRDYLYTRAGGVRAGTARLLGYDASYDDPIYLFADYNAGVFASRNAAFQSVLSDLTGKSLTLDGDLLAYDGDGDASSNETQSLRAMLVFGRTHDMWDWTVRRNAGDEKSDEFESTAIWRKARAAWRELRGKEPPYARIPSVTLKSPKLSGPRSTEWFARSVKRRYDTCLSRG